MNFALALDLDIYTYLVLTFLSNFVYLTILLSFIFSLDQMLLPFTAKLLPFSLKTGGNGFVLDRRQRNLKIPALFCRQESSRILERQEGENCPPSPRFHVTSKLIAKVRLVTLNSPPAFQDQYKPA